MSAIYEKLEALEQRLEVRLKSVEVNMAAGFSAITTRQDLSDGVVAALKEAEIRRDEREKTQGAMLSQVQTSQRWWTITAMGVIVLVVNVGLKFT